MERFRENRHTLRRYTAFVLALAMITTLFVNWQLHGVGISMTAQYQCGEEEHAHGDDCFDPADGVTLRYYSRYGQSYGNPYGEWDVMFLSYCLKYAGIPQSAIPQEASVLALRSSMSDMD